MGMNMKRLLSICTAAYNAEKWIDTMVESIEKCANRDLVELILVNDGSKDNTLKKLHMLQNKYDNILVIDKENGGSGSARNRAFEAATGKYIKLIDADDYVDTENFDHYLECLREVDADMILNGFYIRKTQTGKIECIDYPLEERLYTLKEIGKVQNLRMHGLTYKADIFRSHKIRLSEGISYVDSEYVALPIVYAKTLFYVESPFYIYQSGIEGQSGSRQILIRRIDQKLIVLEKVINSYENAVKTLSCGAETDIPILRGYIADLCRIYIYDILYFRSFRYCGKVRHFENAIRKMSKTFYEEMLQDNKIRIMRKTDYKAYYVIEVWLMCKHSLRIILELIYSKRHNRLHSAPFAKAINSNSCKVLKTISNVDGHRRRAN